MKLETSLEESLRALNKFRWILKSLNQAWNSFKGIWKRIKDSSNMPKRILNSLTHVCKRLRNVLKSLKEVLKKFLDFLIKLEKFLRSSSGTFSSLDKTYVFFEGILYMLFVYQNAAFLFGPIIWNVLSGLNSSALHKKCSTMRNVGYDALMCDRSSWALYKITGVWSVVRYSVWFQQLSIAKKIWYGASPLSNTIGSSSFGRFLLWQGWKRSNRALITCMHRYTGSLNVRWVHLPVSINYALSTAPKRRDINLYKIFLCMNPVLLVAKLS